MQSFVADFASTSREDVFSSPDKVQLLNQVICQHFYRQGMLDIADELAQVMLLLVPLLQKKIIRIMMGAHPRTSCRKLFKKLEILTVPSIYIYSLMSFFNSKSG